MDRLVQSLGRQSYINSSLSPAREANLLEGIIVRRYSHLRITPEDLVSVIEDSEEAEERKKRGEPCLHKNTYSGLAEEKFLWFRRIIRLVRCLHCESIIKSN